MYIDITDMNNFCTVIVYTLHILYLAELKNSLCIYLLIIHGDICSVSCRRWCAEIAPYWNVHIPRIISVSAVSTPLRYQHQLSELSAGFREAFDVYSVYILFVIVVYSALRQPRLPHSTLHLLC